MHRMNLHFSYAFVLMQKLGQVRTSMDIVLRTKLIDAIANNSIQIPT